jgi:hypothetical protein
MSITYERTGGFVGKQEKLTFDPELKTVTASERGQACPPRILTAAESAQLRAWYDQLKGRPAPDQPASARPIPDSFQVRLTLEGGPTVSAPTLGFPLGGQGAFDPLLAWLDRTLTDELRRHHPERPVILTPDELK